MRTIRAIGILAALLLSFGAVQAAEPARATGSVTVNIEPQPLRDALSQFATQTGFQVLRRDEEVALDGLVAPRVVGTYTPDAALGRLLSNTGLTYEFINARTVRISAQPVGKKVDTAAARTFTLAKVTDEAGPAAGLGREVSEGPVSNEEARGIPEMLVKGRRSANSDIERTEDDVQPYVVFKADEIRQSMAGTLEEFLKMRLTMNASPNGNPQVVNNGFSGNVSSIDLRGLGANQTLILVDGRRMPGVSVGGDIVQADINGIPLSSVERIEVLPSTAGGIYGGGATGGVINIVLKSDYRGGELRAVYDDTVRSDYSRRRLEGNAGFTLGNGRTNVMMSGSYAQAGLLEVGERDFLQQARALMLKNNNAVFYGGTSPPAGARSNIRSATTQPLTLKAGNISLNSLIAHVPAGYAGPASDNGRAFLATAGQYNLDVPAGAGGLKRSIQFQSPETYSGSLNLTHDLTARIRLSATAGMYSNTSYSRVNRFPPTVINLPASAPNNPFVQAIRVQFPASDFPFGTALDYTSEIMRAGAGLMVRLGSGWTMQGEYGWNRSSADQQYNPSVVRSTANTALANGTLNIMRDVDAYPLDYSSYLMPVPGYLLPFATQLNTYSVRLAGPAWRLPGGPLTLATLVESRDSTMDSSVTTIYSTSTGLPSYGWTAPRRQQTDSVYVETTAPLISPANARRFAQALDLQVSYRYDRIATRALDNVMSQSISVPSPAGPYPEVGFITNHVAANQYTVGARYQPLKSLALRASRSIGILPPSFSQLAPIIFDNFSVTALDPKRGNLPVGAVEDYFGVGNYYLRPEQSRGWSAGAIFTPAVLSGLRLSLDYTRTRKKDEISSLGAQQILDLEAFLPGRIERAPLTAQDQALNYTGGRILTFYDGLTNIALSEVQSYDLQADYNWRTAYGAFHASFMASRETDLIRRVTATSPARQSVGFTDGPLEWRANAGLTWDRDGWTAGWSMQFYDSYRIYASTATQATIDSIILGQGSATIGSETYHDAYIKYEFGSNPAFARGLLADTEVSLGVRNLFDTSPHIVATALQTVGGYNRHGDPYLRRYSISLTRSFQ